MGIKTNGKNRMEDTLRINGPKLQEFLKTNPSLEDIRKLSLQILVADKDWQLLRHSLVGTWTKTPDGNVDRLRQYAGDFKDPLKIRRLRNYLTGSGFRMGIIPNHKAFELLMDLNTVYNKWIIDSKPKRAL